MPLDKQIINVPLTQGLDTKSDSKSLPVGKLADVINGVYTSPGRIKKRNGHAALSLGVTGGASDVMFGATVAGGGLMDRREELLFADGTLPSGSTLYSFDKGAYAYGSTSSKWVNKGSIPSFTIGSIPIAANANSIGGYDAAFDSTSGLICSVWEEYAQLYVGSNTLNYSVVDSVTKTTVLTGSVSALGGGTPTVGAPKVIRAGGFFLVLWINNIGVAQNILYGLTINASTLAVSAASAYTDTVPGVATTSLSGTYPRYDAVAIGSSVFISYINNIGAPNGIRTLKAATSAPLTVTANRNEATLGAAILTVFNEASTSRPLVAYIATNLTTVGFVALKADLSGNDASNTSVEVVAGGYLCSITGASATTASVDVRLFYSWHNAAGTPPNPNDYIKTVSLTTASFTVGTPSRFMAQVTAAGKVVNWSILSGGPGYTQDMFIPVVLETRTYAGVGSPQNTWFLADINGKIVAKAYAGTAGGRYLNAYDPSHIIQMLPETTYQTDSNNLPIIYCPVNYAYVAGRFALRCLSVVLGYRQDYTLSNPDVPLPSPFCRAQLAGDLLIGGAAPQTYDGQTVAEHGFLYYPVLATAAAAAAGGSIATGTYSYIVIYEWVDANGQLHRSTPSEAQSIVVAADSSKVTLTLPYIYLTSKTASSIMITIYRTAANGTTYYQINNLGASSITANSTSGSANPQTTTYVDTQADASITSNAQLYTTGGRLQNAAPPPFGAVVAHRNRLVGIDTTNPLSLWYSFQVIAGSPVEFSTLQTLNIDPKGGDCTALGSMDEKLIVFKKSRTFVVAGQGPDANGGQNDFLDAVEVSSDVGCISPRSVVVTPLGLMFQSLKGIYLLGRDLVMRYIGGEVETYNGEYVVDAVLVPNTTQIRFLTYSRTLVYDYLVGQWSRFTGAGPAACVWLNQYVYVEGNTGIYKETVGTFADPSSTFIPLTVKTGWISLAGIQGFKRIYKVLVLGDYVGTHILTATIYNNFDTSAATQTSTVTPTGNPYQFRIFMARQKCESIQIQLADSTNGSANEGMDLAGLAFEVGVKRGGFRLPAGSSL